MIVVEAKTPGVEVGIREFAARKPDAETMAAYLVDLAAKGLVVLRVDAKEPAPEGAGQCQCYHGVGPEGRCSAPATDLVDSRFAVCVDCLSDHQNS